MLLHIHIIIHIFELIRYNYTDVTMGNKIIKISQLFLSNVHRTLYNKVHVQNYTV